MIATTEYAERLEALKRHLILFEDFTEDELDGQLVETEWKRFEVYGREYAVLTDEEADREVREYILETLWAFRPHFILMHTDFFHTSTIEADEAFEESLEILQGRLCEDANPIILALIRDIDEFIDDAIEADGRGHFLATYDGDERETNDCKYYIYRMN